MTKCLCLEEHMACMNFVSEGQEPAIRIIDMSKGTCNVVEPGLGRFVMLLKGKVNFSLSIVCNDTIRRNQMFYLPVGYGTIFYAIENSCLVLVRLDNKIHFCESFRMEQLVNFIHAYDPIRNESPTPCLLPVNTYIKDVINQIRTIMETGYNCRIYFEKKIEELFMIMRFSYTREQLACLFREIISPDSHFAYQVVHNYQRFQNLSELAVYMGMTLHAFERRFSGIFGKSGYRWINEQRKRKIYHAITTKNENFKELSIMFGFSSPAAFNDYCKLYLGDTPGKIRKKVKTANICTESLAEC